MNLSQWITVLAALWAALATTWAATATKTAPIRAAKLASSLQAESEKRRLKLWIFGAIMQNRHFLGEPECVKALNIIDAIFFDVPDVRDAWANLYTVLNDPRNFPPTGPLPAVDEKRTALLTAIAKDLGLITNFRPDDFSRVYLPQSIVEDMHI
jgi:hypothetical protein